MLKCLFNEEIECSIKYLIYTTTVKYFCLFIQKLRKYSTLLDTFLSIYIGLYYISIYLATKEIKCSIKYLSI